MKRHLNKVIALGVMLIFLAIGCATLNSLLKINAYVELQGIMFNGEKVPGFLIPDKYDDFTVAGHRAEYFYPAYIANELTMLSWWTQDHSEVYNLVVGSECPVLLAFQPIINQVAEFYRYEEGKPVQCTEEEYRAILETPFECAPKTVDL